MIKKIKIGILCLFLTSCIVKPVFSADGDKIVQVAKKYLGNPYKYGGSSLTEGCDCSHFVWLVLQQAIDYKEPYTTSWGFETMGQEVQSLQQAVAGDVICYGPHVAIYDGEGKIIEAKGRAYGITDDREAQYTTIVTIRRFF